LENVNAQYRTRVVLKTFTFVAMFIIFYLKFDASIQIEKRHG
jgi:hypothetical protein